MTPIHDRATITADVAAPATAELEAWCALDPHLRFVSAEPARFELTLPSGPTIVSASSEPPFVTFSCRLSLPGSAPQDVDKHLRWLVDARSALVDATLAPDGSAVDLNVKVHEDGLNAHTFLVSAEELRKLARSLDAATAADGPAVEAPPAPSRSFAEFEAEQRRAYMEAQQAAEAEARRADVFPDSAPTAMPARPAEPPPVSRAPEPVPATPQPVTCSNCGSAIAPGRAFCTNCGTPVAGGATAPTPAAPPRAAAAGRSLLAWAVVGGFVVAVIGTFLDWVESQGIGFSAWADESRYRFADWLDTDLPVDALLVVALAGLGIALLVAPQLARSGAPPVLAIALGVALAVVAVLEIAYITSEAEFSFIGLGLWAVLAGAAVAAVSGYFETQRGGSAQRPASG